MAAFRWKVIRTVFGLGERVAPGLSGRAAFVLFSLTPNPRKLTERERQAVRRADGFMQGARHHRMKLGSGCVMAHEFRPDGPPRGAGTVLVVHGWRSRTEYMTALIEGYRRAGFRVISLDLPGHGQSQGRRLTLPIGIEAVALAAQWFGPFEAVVGHSFGGLVLVNAVTGSLPGVAPVSTERLVLISAPNAISELLAGFGRMVHLGPRSFAALAARVEKISGRRLVDFDGARLLSQVAVPTLVVHAPDDREIRPADASAYADAGAHVTLHWADGLGHRRILSDAAIVARAVDFLADRQSPMKSVA